VIIYWSVWLFYHPTAIFSSLKTLQKNWVCGIIKLMPKSGLYLIALFLTILISVFSAGHSFAYFSKKIYLLENKITTALPNFDLSTPDKTTTLVCNFINSKNYGLLWEISATEVKESFTKVQFVNSFEEGSIKSCQIISSATYLSSLSAKAKLQITNNSLEQEFYLLALKKENDGWKMLGTERE